MTPKEKIIADLARSRAAIASDSAKVHAAIDFSAKIQRSVKSRPFTWLSCAAAIGYIIAGPKTRTKTITKVVRDKNLKNGSLVVQKKSRVGLLTLLFAALKLAIPILRPALSAYAVRHLGAYAEKLGR